MKRFGRVFLLAAALLFGAWLSAAIPESWLARKATVGGATREAIYALCPPRHVCIAELPERWLEAFEGKPAGPEIYAGEAYFVDHALNHHPEVEDRIYRELERILEDPDEVIRDRRFGRDGLVFAKTVDGVLYALVIRLYPDGRLQYKTLFPSDGKLYPKLPRYYRRPASDGALCPAA